MVLRLVGELALGQGCLGVMTLLQDLTAVLLLMRPISSLLLLLKLLQEAHFVDLVSVLGALRSGLLSVFGRAPRFFLLGSILDLVGEFHEA